MSRHVGAGESPGPCDPCVHTACPGEIRDMSGPQIISDTHFQIREELVYSLLENTGAVH